MKYCHNCGKEVEERNAFCPNCGTKLVNDNQNLDSEKKEFIYETDYKDGGNSFFYKEGSTVKKEETPNSEESNYERYIKNKNDYLNVNKQSCSNSKPKKIEQSNSSFATIGFIVSLISFILVLIPFASLVGTVIGIVYSSIGLSSEKKSQAKAGLILGILAIIIKIIIIVIIIINIVENNNYPQSPNVGTWTKYLF